MGDKKMKTTDRHWDKALDLVSVDEALRTGWVNGPNGRQRLKEKWTAAAEVLNRVGGVQKDGAAWKEAFGKFKSRCQAAYQAYKTYLNGTGAGPTPEEIMKGLTAVQKRCISICGTGSGTVAESVADPLLLQKEAGQSQERNFNVNHTAASSNTLNDNQRNTCDAPLGKNQWQGHLMPLAQSTKTSDVNHTAASLGTWNDKQCNPSDAPGASGGNPWQGQRMPLTPSTRTTDVNHTAPSLGTWNDKQCNPSDAPGASGGNPWQGQRMPLTPSTRTTDVNHTAPSLGTWNDKQCNPSDAPGASGGNPWEGQRMPLTPSTSTPLHRLPLFSENNQGVLSTGATEKTTLLFQSALHFGNQNSFQEQTATFGSNFKFGGLRPATPMNRTPNPFGTAKHLRTPPHREGPSESPARKKLSFQKVPQDCSNIACSIEGIHLAGHRKEEEGNLTKTLSEMQLSLKVVNDNLQALTDNVKSLANAVQAMKVDDMTVFIGDSLKELHDALERNTEALNTVNTAFKA